MRAVVTPPHSPGKEHGSLSGGDGIICVLGQTLPNFMMTNMDGPGNSSGYWKRHFGLILLSILLAGFNIIKIVSSEEQSATVTDYRIYQFRGSASHQVSGGRCVSCGVAVYHCRARVILYGSLMGWRSWG